MNNNETYKKYAEEIIKDIVFDINPYEKTKECVDSFSFNDGKKILISIGKASWTMAKAVYDVVDVDEGAVITKYKHSKGQIGGIKVYEAGHPIVDKNSVDATEYVLSITSNLKENDNVIVCLSGGGSSLFEKPLIELSELQNINDQLIKSGASISEINVIRKKLSGVKGGKFAKHVYPAKIFAIILSDVIGDDIGTIASGPISNNISNGTDAINIINKYNISVSNSCLELLLKDAQVLIDNSEYKIIGSNKQLCEYTKLSCEKHGYKGIIVSNDCIDSVEKISNRFKEIINKNKEHNVAYIVGGEASIEVKGNGIGGRNTHLAILVSKYIFDRDNICFFAFASDGTDGPTDCAGAYVDKNTYNNSNIEKFIENYDSYSYFSMIDGLIKTGPTGCNINDVYVLLIQ